MASSSALVERRVELERPVVERERLIDLAELPRAHDGRRVHVLRALLRVLDEVGEAEDDLDELRPVLLLRVELHQLRQELAVVGPLLERREVRLACARARSLELLELDVADLEEKLEALGADRDLEAPPLRAR